MAAASAAPAQERVRVFARQRPLGRGEEQDVAAVIADPSSGEVTVNITAADAVERVLSGGNLDAAAQKDESQNGLRRFRFDAAFDAGSSQDEVFQNVGLPVLKDVMRGFHGCVMAYGQTGSGKTHSLLNTGSPEQAGLLPRLIATLFVRIGADQGHRHQVRVSAVQVYNEQISDLLHPDHAGGGGQGLNVQSNGSVQGATWLPCRDPQSAMKAFAQARTNIVYAETKMNKASSRSHAVCQIEVARFSAKDEGSNAKATLGVLTVVDLAGSERVKRSGVAGQQMKEAININGSLLSLGNVVQALASQKKHVPFRDSKLTRILEPALSGNCRTSLLVCVSPTLESAQETCHALEFASRAMRVEVCAKVNEVDVTSLCNELSQLAAVPVADGADKELRQKTKEISSLEEKLTQSAQEAKKWEDKSSQEAKKAKDLQEVFRKEASELERKHREAVEQSSTQLKKLREESEAELARQKKQVSELGAEAASAKRELQASKKASEAALAAKQSEATAAKAEAASARSIAEKAAAEQGRVVKELKEAHQRHVKDLEARHGQREAELQGHVEHLRRELEGASKVSESEVEAKDAELQQLRTEVQRLEAAAREASGKQEELRQEQRRQVDALRAEGEAHVAELEAAMARLGAASEASRAQLEASLAEVRAALRESSAEAEALRGELREAREASEAARGASAARLEALQQELCGAREGAEAAGRQLAELREEAARERERALAQARQAEEQLERARGELGRAERQLEEERRAAEARQAEQEALAQGLRQELRAAGLGAAALGERCQAAEAALARETAALERAHAADREAAQAAHREELAALVAAHKASQAELRAQHAERVAALTEGHEAAVTELRWRLAETEDAYKGLQRRFEVRESRQEDIAAIARQRKTIRELSSERKQLDLQLQHQLQTDKVFGGGEKKRSQAHLRNAAVGKKLSSSGSFNHRRDELIDQISGQDTSPIIEPIY